MERRVVTYLVFFYILFFNTIFPESLSRNIFKEKLSHLFFDAGENLDLYSIFRDINYINTQKNIIKPIKFSFSIQTINQDMALIGYTRFYFKKYFFAYLITNSGSNRALTYNNNSGISNHLLGKRNVFFKNSRSGFGFKNDWVSLKIIKGNESWGAGNNIQLALSSSSQPYDYISLGSDYGNIRVKYIHGFLEKTSNHINRYITAKGIEFTNNKNFNMALSETIIYSGLNRSMEIGYFNPVGSHLEIELNNRLNIIGDGSSNAVWQFHSDFFIKNKIRLSLNYLYDEFVIDKDIQLEKEHGKAYSTRFSYTVLNKKDNILNLYLQNIYVGTPTFRHGVGTNNFVQNNFPIGWAKGSDSEEILIGANYSNKKSFLLLINTGINLSGDENIQKRVFDKYQDYLKGDFPSGIIKETIFFNFNFEYLLNQKVRLSLFSNFSKKRGSYLNLHITLDLPWFRVF